MGLRVIKVIIIFVDFGISVIASSMFSQDLGLEAL